MDRLFKFVPKAQGGRCLAATDSYQVSRKLVSVIEKSTDIQDVVSIIVQARTVGELSRILSVFKDGIGNQEIDVVISDNRFAYNNAELISRTIEENILIIASLFPNVY